MQHFIFDLDGTISNPEQGIVNGYKYAFGKLQIPIPSH
jgi:phosphoglycolate phosphatase-like HAD superfamily hydrolase